MKKAEKVNNLNKTQIVYLLTKNKFKWMAASSAFDKSGIDLIMLDKEYPEIQADTSVEIAKHTALAAAKENKCVVIREDHSFFINGLHGFPGPYAHYFEERISAETILDLMKGCKDRTGYFELGAVIAWQNGSFKEFSNKVPIIVSNVCHGKRAGWDKILMFPDDTKTFGEYDEQGNVGGDADKWNKNFASIIKYLKER